MATLKQLQLEISNLEQSGATEVPMATVKALIQEVNTLFGQGSGGNSLFGELGQLAKYLNEMRKELYAMQQDDLAEAKIPDAASQLQAVLDLTEKAAGSIMAECEAIEDKLSGVDAATQEAIQESITKIYEALSFQDITGQRLQKIITVLQEVERQILRMVVVFGLKSKTAEDGLDSATKDKLESEAELLSGPQLPGQGLEQDQVDDILNKLL